uniref:Large ribosomal subunit protein uL22c n=1 Tax=Dysphania ambrosioides TaxID=330163 RepID=A0A411HSA9_DYSAM|nr:ribosomal protein L22 [Dysphania ambrosioides]QBB73470.1 ribosomal protein L22 [Dysphania ambrosioides]
MGFLKKKKKDNEREFDVFRMYGTRHPEPGECDETTARGHSISMSVDKARRVIDQIRGRSYAETLMILELMPYRACYPIFKLIYSAAANGRHKKKLNKASLIVSKAEVNKGITLKKLKPRARGRNYLLKRTTCHITIVLRDINHFDEYDKFLESFPPKTLITSFAIRSRGRRREFLCGRFRENHKIKSFLYKIGLI